MGRPRPRRGGELRIARGDSERLETIWRATREDFGSQSIERCTIVRDGRAWWLGSAGGPGTIRYVESVVFGERLLFFFERMRLDGAHELVLSSAPVSGSDRGSPG